MLSVAGGHGIYLYCEATDMRKSFRGLCALVYSHLGRPDSGYYYVSVNRRRTHVKILYWDGDGLALWYKRLEKGQFVIPHRRGTRLELTRRDLSLLLEGVTPLRQERRYFSQKNLNYPP